MRPAKPKLLVGCFGGIRVLSELMCARVVLVSLWSSHAHNASMFTCITCLFRCHEQPQRTPSVLLRRVLGSVPTDCEQLYICLDEWTGADVLGRVVLPACGYGPCGHTGRTRSCPCSLLSRALSRSALSLVGNLRPPLPLTHVSSHLSTCSAFRWPWSRRL